jgi:hypothetical protein
VHNIRHLSAFNKDFMGGSERNRTKMIQELPELKVTVDKVVFAPHLEAPPDRPYPFV